MEISAIHFENFQLYQGMRMITVRQLEEMLKGVKDKSALVYINEIAIIGVEVHNGRYDTTHDGADMCGNIKFRKTPKGKQRGLTFTNLCEYSDGVIGETDFWYS